MTLHEAITEIESHEFAARVGVASDLRTFLSAIEGEEAVRFLLKELKSPQAVDSIGARILVLSKRETDPRYENELDTALAVYLYVVNLKCPDLTKKATAAAFVLHVPNCWYARKVARDIIFRPLLSGLTGVL